MEPAAFCSICKRLLDVDYDPLSINCGGDCMSCMAACGDPDAIAYIKKMDARKELIEFIKDNLTISINTTVDWENDSKYLNIEISLLLDGESFSSDYSSIGLPDS